MFIVASIYSPPLCDIFGVSALLSTQSEAVSAAVILLFIAVFVCQYFQQCSIAILKDQGAAISIQESNSPGSALQIQESDLRVQHCQFRNQISGFSTANSGTRSQGSALPIQEPDLRVQHCQFKNPNPWTRKYKF
jgi:hypothetical protein